MTKNVSRADASAASAAAKARDTSNDEGLFDRADALVAGVALSAGTLYYINSFDEVKNFSPATAPFLFGDYRHTYPFVAVVAYLVLVHAVGPVYKKVGPALELKPLLKAWNLFLSFGSLVMLLGISIPLVRRAGETGYSPYEFMCDPTLVRWSGTGYFWVYVFTLSKYAELFDTVLLVLRKRSIGFLHWYHHATVLAYTWYAVGTRFSGGWMFSSVNATVHTIMYWYYYRAACGKRLTYAKFITQIQIAQMGLGIAIASTWSYLHLFGSRPCPCDAAVPVMISSLLIYGTYGVLFLQFYINRYNKGKRDAAAAAKKSE